ncbi:G-protein coupled receptor family C group 6 member A-like [Colossoma macropomum]|uniref:G-protein coupled receptor family C group 6 member A-like n=1 Tax=Colossoma macropomum TaxID=42526 RepID=UPI001863CE59|nr:G-protein coupled receptor family C group 6 member A-like [Colossoma macropomum]
MASCLSSLCFCGLWVAVMLGLGVCSDDTESLSGAYAPGDIIIGILGSVHSKVKDLQDRVRPDKYTCTDFDLIPFVQSLAVIYTIEEINDSGFLPGIRLGYLMCDPCVYATKALQCVEHMLSINKTLAVYADNSNFSSPVKAFLGERYSELSIPVAKLLSLYMIPQISCTSSSPALSDKLRYASFFRVIPSDVYQTKALAKLMAYFNWDWVGVVSIDDDYGKPALENFLLERKEHICVDFQELLPNYLGFINIEQRIMEVANRIRSSTAKVVLLILRPELVEMLFQELIKTNTTRIWIASDAWSMARLVMKMKDINKVGEIFGFTFITSNIPGFEDYLQNLTISPGAKNDFIEEYKQIRFNCSSDQQSEHTSPVACNITGPQEANDDYLLHSVHLTKAYSQRVAVYAIAHAIKKVLQCNNTACSGNTNFMSWQLVDVLRKVNFTLDDETYSFNQVGDFENGYDLIMWKESGAERIPDVVGRFLIKNDKVEIDEHKIPWTNNTVPRSRCSEPCPPGTEKNISSISCCYTCTNCTEGYYSNATDQPACQKCPEGSWSLPGSRECQRWNIWFLEWSSAYSIVVVIGTVIGALLLVFSFIFFILHREKHIIKDILVISCLMKFGLMVSFGGVILFLGSPNIHLCRAQQTMYGLGFTLCVSCILVKALHIFLELMSSNPAKQRKLRKFDKPFVIIGILTAIQALICIFWMIFDPVNVEETQSKTQLLTMNRLCTQGSMYGFGVMHVYIALLAVLSFGLAFKGRDNETDPIVFSMLIHLFAWLCFIPIFITQYDSRPIVQISGIMVSNYGVICCHFAPKWFKILSEKAETKKAVKPPVESLTNDSDSGVVCGTSSETASIPSTPQSQFSIAESEQSNWDINSLHLSEASIASFRRRRLKSWRSRSLRPRSLRPRSWTLQSL